MTANKAYCFVCSVLCEGFDRERSEKAWIEGINGWSKMKESRGKNKVGKLKAYFYCPSHMAALHDFIAFVRGDGQVDFLFTKQQKRNIIDNEAKQERYREVIAMLFDVGRIRHLR